MPLARTKLAQISKANSTFPKFTNNTKDMNKNLKNKQKKMFKIALQALTQLINSVVLQNRSGASEQTSKEDEYSRQRDRGESDY